VISELHPDTKRKVHAALDAIVADPTVGEMLRDRLAGFRRLRIGRWRIVYRERPGEIEIQIVGPRSTVYSELVAALERGIRERGPRYRRGRRSSRGGPLTLRSAPQGGRARRGSR